MYLGEKNMKNINDIQKQIDKIEYQRRILSKEFEILKEKLTELKTQKNKLIEEKKLNNGHCVTRISDHFMLRFLERIENIDVNNYRDILQEKLSWTGGGKYYIEKFDCYVVVENNTAITCYKPGPGDENE